MNGEVAQLAALVTHGSRYLAEGGDPPELFPDNSTFSDVNAVGFGDGLSATAPWLERLKARSASRLWLHLPVSDRMLSGFVGRMQAGMWVDGPERAVWTPRWQVLDPRPSRPRIWRVDYGALPLLAPMPRATLVLDVPSALEQALIEAEQIADRHEFLGSFRHWFEGARAMLRSDEPVFQHHPDLVPADWSLEGRRLLAAAERAWVFGAMGSWNDIGFEDEELERDYKAVSERLYSAVCAATVAGANMPLSLTLTLQ